MYFGRVLYFLDGAMWGAERLVFGLGTGGTLLLKQDAFWMWTLERRRTKRGERNDADITYRVILL